MLHAAGACHRGDSCACFTAVRGKGARKSVADWIARVLDGTASLRAGPPQPAVERRPRAVPDGVPRPGGRKRRAKRLKTEPTWHEC